MKLTILGSGYPCRIRTGWRPHPQESLALRLKDEDLKIFVYTSDTGFSDDLAPFAKDAPLATDGMFFQESDDDSISDLALSPAAAI